MMTPAQLKQYEFKAVGRNAYKADEVDSFLAEVLISYEKIYRENGELIKRISLLADRLQQIKNDEANAMNAQKSADIITKDAENILEAARNEAALIKSDAEKQAIADSELLLSMARDKAEDIMKKAKEKAHGILIAANDSASNTVGAANRTITSESIHYDMLKKEVSEFRSSILAQYKAHIELISKLPELAVQEAAKIDVATPPVADVSVENLESKLEEEAVGEPEDAIIEFSDSDEAALANEADIVEEPADVAESEGEIEASDSSDEIPAVQTTIVFDLNDHSQNAGEEPVVQDIPVSKRFTVNTDDLTFDGFDDEDFAEDVVEEEPVEEKSVEVAVEDISFADDSVDEVLNFDETAEDAAEEADAISYEVDETEDAEEFEDIALSDVSEETVAEETVAEEIADEDDGPDVILSFGDVNYVLTASTEDGDSESSDNKEVENDSESVAQEAVDNSPADNKPLYEDVYSNSDTDQFDDLIIAFDDDDNTKGFKSVNEPEPTPQIKTEESPQSRRNRYAKMFGDDYEDDGGDDSIASFFGSIETISVDDEDDVVEKPKRGFFRRKK